VKRMSHECMDLLDQIFQLDEKKRIKIADIKKHPWYTEPLSPRYDAAMKRLMAEQAELDRRLALTQVRPPVVLVRFPGVRSAHGLQFAQIPHARARTSPAGWSVRLPRASPTRRSASRGATQLSRFPIGLQESGGFAAKEQVVRDVVARACSKVPSPATSKLEGTEISLLRVPSRLVVGMPEIAEGETDVNDVSVRVTTDSAAA
jgi:serine/threonine protein kinase